MANQREERTKVEKMIAGEIPSSIPVNITRGSYAKMLAHGSMNGGIWKCGSTGGQFKMKMLYMNIYDSITSRWSASVPVGHIYCSVCDKVPQVRSGDSIFNTDIQTYYL